jgi:hypothetical protein
MYHWNHNLGNNKRKFFKLKNPNRLQPYSEHDLFNRPRYNSNVDSQKNFHFEKFMKAGKGKSEQKYYVVRLALAGQILQKKLMKTLKQNGDTTNRMITNAVHCMY